ncbi:MAG: LCP family protein [Actinobacteria bacterium]|nr:LCP family protein [Actinomycetota bacterium]
MEDKLKNIKKTKPVKDNSVKKAGKWSGLKTYKKVLIIVFSAIFLIAAGAGSYIYYYINNVNKTIKSGTTTEISEVLTPTKTPEAPITVLLLGRDTRDAETERGRTDTIMLLHINFKEKRASLLSIPRDTLVEIPGYGQDKINAAYAYGGEELMIKTVSLAIDAVINHYVTIDFEGFIKLIDELGGVDVVVERPLEDPYSGAYISAGNHHFTGEQALSYTRSRSTELGDIGRIQRQQYIIKELIDQKLNLKNVSKINDYFNIIIENTKTDIDLLTIISYAKSALSFGTENLSTAIIPTHPDWIDEGTKSVQVPDLEEAKAMWQRIIFGQPVSRYGIEYLSGSENIDESMLQDKLYNYKITVKNTGTLEWKKEEPDSFYLSYHWLDFETKKAIDFEGKRSILPVDSVPPGQAAEIDFHVQSPASPGQYILQIDMVHEGKTWFSYQGVPTLEKYVAVNVNYAASYADNGSTPNEIRPGEEFTSKVTVVNNGYMDWLAEADKPVRLGYHWYNRDTREVIAFGAGRGLLPQDVGHKGSAEVEISITAPEKPGRYILAYDLVHEKVTWFSQQGIFPLEVDVNVGITIDNAIVKKTSVAIYNGCGVSGVAADFRDYIRNYNFNIYGLANAENFEFEQTVLIYKSGKKENADQISRLLYSYDIEEYSSQWEYYDSSADIVIILGKDYKENIRQD